MARRKKQPLQEHRGAIAAAAAALFEENGAASTTMDDIAHAAGYSKATVYVYFKNKDEIVSLLTLESMRRLREHLCRALDGAQTARRRYELICRELTAYQAKYPFYFKTALEKIRLESGAATDGGRTFSVGEEINALLTSFLRNGMERGELRRDIEPFPTLFAFWGALSGLILLAESKSEYIQETMGMDRGQFLSYGFDMLYRGVAAGSEGGVEK